MHHIDTKLTRRLVISALGGPQAFLDGSATLRSPANELVPEPLQPWHGYSGHYGHIIAAVFDHPLLLARATGDPPLPIAIPTKAVLRSRWHIGKDGLPHVAPGHIDYDTKHGLIVDDEDIDTAMAPASHDYVVGLHEAILMDVPDIRVMTRWGWEVEYTTRVKSSRAAAIWGKPFVDVSDEGTFRLEWGISIAPDGILDTAGRVSRFATLQYRHGRADWVPVQSMESTSFSSGDILRRAMDHLAYTQPEFAVLLELDALMLRSQLAYATK